LMWLPHATLALLKPVIVVANVWWYVVTGQE
jgi:hypothetical protein